MGLPCSGGNPPDLAHDRNDLLHDITAGATGSSTSQQILNRGADLRFGLVRVHKIPIVLI
jgi:hypothetical protein